MIVADRCSPAPTHQWPLHGPSPVSASFTSCSMSTTVIQTTLYKVKSCWSYCKRWCSTSLVPLLLADEALLPEVQTPGADTPSSSGTAGAAPSRARPCCKNGCLRGIRPWLVGAILVSFIVWLPLDIVVWDGLVPGTKDQYQIELKPLSEHKNEVVAWNYNGTGDSKFTCMCTYKSSRSSATKWSAPFAELMPHVPKINWVMHKLSQLCNVSTYQIRDNTATGNATWGLITRFVTEAQMISIAPPTSALLLTHNAWQAARLADASRQLSFASRRATTDIQAAVGVVGTNSTNETYAEFGRRFEQYVLYEIAYASILRALLVPDSSTSVATINDISKGVEQREMCNVVDQPHLNPFKLQERCCPRQNTSTPGVLGELMPNCTVQLSDCNDAYMAYFDWCEPEVCHAFKKKHPYLQAMQVMSAFGGLWGLLGLVILIGWQCCFLGCWAQIKEARELSQLPAAAVAGGAAAAAAAPAATPPGGSASGPGAGTTTPANSTHSSSSSQAPAIPAAGPPPPVAPPSSQPSPGPTTPSPVHNHVGGTAGSASVSPTPPASGTTQAVNSAALPASAGATLQSFNSI